MPISYVPQSAEKAVSYSA